MEPNKANLEGLRIQRRQEEPTGSTWKRWAAAVVILGIAAAAVFWLWPRNRAIAVVTATAQERGSTSTDRTVLNASGYVTARRQATVSSKTTGKVMEVLIEEGMHVKKDQVLARLDDSNVQASLAVAKAQHQSTLTAMDETRVRLAQAEKDLKRTAALAADHVTSASNLDSAEADMNSLKARLENEKSAALVAQRQVDLLNQDLDDTVIRAPFDGVVVSKNAQPGEMISPISAGGGFTRTGICTVVDMNSLEIDVDVNENYITRVTENQPVTAVLDAYPDWTIPAHVIAIVPTADRQKATVPVRIAFEHLDPRILPDMGVKVAFQETETPAGSSAKSAANAVTVPASAVRETDGRSIVWVVKDHVLEHRAVTLERRDGNEAILLTGISAGEKVVVSGPQNLRDGLRVRD